MPISATQNLIQKTLKPRGVHFPFSKRGDGLPSADGPPNIFASNIKQILLTTPGERVMRLFGSGLKSLLFENTKNPNIISMAQSIIETAIRVGEPRVRIVSIDVKVENTTIQIKVTYKSGVGVGSADIVLKNKKETS